ncbi:hypothetical protein ACXR8U_03495 [Methylobacterium radiotolerans]|jgi:hypothetical protein|uniref:hypothetical protein n=1 Tax=Methylobacterium TaxID=407 RepID=UPI0005E95E23|nr:MULTISPECIES: hypothetical protein [Methylobacterium]MBN6820443.1 hypothetical protein [Methylobacterium organophilum]OXE42488.1 hypothetical protein CCS92_07435 [Methylobacterium radiotolerans]GAN47116.1 hypothetical protein ME121_1122 [Methylobacterium sp. ME121]
MAAHANAALDRAGPVAGTSGGRAGGPLAAAGPILAMLAALALVAATGLSQRDAVPEALEPWIFGYFIGRYPLFAFALVYGLGHLARVATGPGPASAPRRLVFGLAGAAALLAAGLYPTFGGLVLRGAFATGGMAFLTHQPLWLAYGLGTAVGALMFGGVLGLFAIAANRPLRPRLRRIVYGALAFLALWFGAILIGLAGDLGVGPWPRRAMRPEEAALAAGLLVAAALPHAALATLLRHRPAL